jgi:hypothetical protein
MMAALKFSTEAAEVIQDARRFRRVVLELRAAVVLDRETACLARTIDLSEGGILLEDYHGPSLSRGRLVGVNLRGVLSDQADGDSEQYLMRVVCHRGEQLALRFAE